MVKEMLQTIDHLGLLRNPSWDGVRVLMLLMPLTEGTRFTRSSSGMVLTFLGISLQFRRCPEHSRASEHVPVNNLTDLHALPPRRGAALRDERAEENGRRTHFLVCLRT